MALLAMRLAGAQEKIRKTEQDMLAKTFDITSIKNFLANHQNSLHENQELSTETQQLLAQVQALKAKLMEASTTGRVATNTYHDEQTLQRDAAARAASAQAVQAAPAAQAAHAAQAAQTAQVGAAPGPAGPPMPAPKAKPTMGELLKSLKDLAGEDENVEISNEELAKGNELLRRQNAEAIQTVETVVTALTGARNSLAKKKAETDELKLAAKTQRDYDMSCRSSQVQLKKDIKEIQDARVKAKEALHNARNVNLGTLHTLSHDNNELKVRLTKSRANEATIQAQILSFNEQTAAIQMQGEQELQHLQAQLDVLTSKALALEGELTSEMEERKVIEKDIRRLTITLRGLEAAMQRGDLAALEANNTHLKKELSSAQSALQVSKSNMAASHAQAAHATDALVILRRKSEADAAAAQKIARDALAKVVAAKGSDDADMKTAEESSLNAESARPEDCDALWDKEHADLLAQLDQCPQVYQDLLTASAQVGSLTSMVAAAGR